MPQNLGCTKLHNDCDNSLIHRVLWFQLAHRFEGAAIYAHYVSPQITANDAQFEQRSGRFGTVMKQLGITSRHKSAKVSRLDGGQVSVSIVAMLLLLWTSAVFADNGTQQSFDALVPFPPSTVRSDGQRVLLYELHMTNFTPNALVLRAVRVLNADGQRTLTEFSDSLADHLVVVGTANSAGPKSETVVEPGKRAILFVELTLDEHSVPVALRHDIDYSPVGERSVNTLHVGDVLVDKTVPAVLGAPFREGMWVAVHSPAWPRGHRRVIYALSGKARIPGRYAIDFVGVDALGRSTHGDSDVPSNAIGYGASVLAGADATVAAARDGMAESPSIRGNPAHALGEGAGNYVALSLSANRYVFYEHLAPGSIRVKVGEHVHLGDVIGSLGFAGDTTGPHLHVHVADGVDPLAAEGLPFVIESYREIGRYSNIGDLGQRRWETNGTSSGQNRVREWPAANAVIEFNRR